MTFANDPATVLPSLALLSHRVRVLPMDAASLVKMPENTILFLDARDDLATAKTLCRLIHASGLSTPIVLVLTEGGFTVVNSQWGIADVVVTTASPAEVEGRLRLVSERGNAPTAAAAGSPAESTTTVEDGQIRSGDLIVDTNGYTASLHGRPIDLAYKEFELLKYLVQHPGRVFTRAQLLQEVWGYDYYGGTRTVDVHIRRLRAKLGATWATDSTRRRRIRKLPPHSRPPKHPLPPSTPMTILPISTPPPDRPAALQTINHRHYAA